MTQTTDFNGHQSGTHSPQTDTFIARGHEREKGKRKFSIFAYALLKRKDKN